ncbi:hypothetical protein F4802DRAFT_602948 [Xylaria palmicola]|nr:hypothetical protein F4802DRAFT_602948 [Xylaria palmicola]
MASCACTSRVSALVACGGSSRAAERLSKAISPSRDLAEDPPESGTTSPWTLTLESGSAVPEVVPPITSREEGGIPVVYMAAGARAGFEFFVDGVSVTARL